MRWTHWVPRQSSIGSWLANAPATLKLAALAVTSSVPKPFTVARDGFSLNAAVVCAPHQRDRIERLCRYITRPALALERLSTNGAGQVVYQLKTPYRDGATHFVFEPLEFLARLAALVPRPRGNLVRYHGILAPNAKHRSAVVPNASKRTRRRRTPAHPRVQVPGRSCCIDRADELDGAAAQSIRNRSVDLPGLRRSAARHRRCHPSGHFEKILEHAARQQAPPEFSAISRMVTVHGQSATPGLTRLVS
jgi:hypothetical protein